MDANRKYVYCGGIRGGTYEWENLVDYTGSYPIFVRGTPTEIEILVDQTANVATLYIDGVTIHTCPANWVPYLASGGMGVYNGYGSAVDFTNFQVNDLSSGERFSTSMNEFSMLALQESCSFQ